MTQRTFTVAATTVFAIVAALHALRVLFGWDLVIGGWEAPTGLSILAVLVTGTLAWSGARLCR